MIKVMSESLKFLKLVILKHGYCNIMIAQMMQQNDFSLSEKEQIKKYVNGTLKHQIYLDYLLTSLINKLNLSFVASDFAIEFKIFLWLLFYHFYFNENSNFEKDNKIFLDLMPTVSTDYTFLVEKILTYLEKHPHTEFDLDMEKSLEQKLIKYSYPRWLYNLLQQEFSTDIANQLLDDNIKDPVISFRVNTLKYQVEDVLNNKHYHNYHFKLSKLVPDGVISEKEILTTELYRSGKIIKQDQASMLISHILKPKPYDVIWDMCGGIGSKSAHLAALMKNHSKIYMTDIDEKMIAYAQDYFRRLGVTNVQTEVINALKAKPKYLFDKILIDAPSTAFGLIKRKPELKLISWTNVAIEQLITLQAQLLEKGYYALKGNGTMIYVTCTFNILENQRQIEKFIQKFPDMIILEEKQYFGYEEQIDGFYLCKLKKTEENKYEN